MRSLHFLQLCAVAATLSVGASSAHALIHLELEGGGGLNLNGDTAPLVTGRVGLNLISFLTVSLRGEGAFGAVGIEDGRTASTGVGYQAWSVFPELRLSTPLPVISADVALGAGLGHLTGMAITKPGALNANDGAQPFGQLGVGVRIDIPRTSVFVRAEGSVAVYTGVTGPDIVSGGLLPVYQVQLMLGYDGIGF